MDVIVVIVGIVAFFATALGLAARRDQRKAKAQEEFGLKASLQPRTYVERLIANCNDSSSSTFFEALALVERDANQLSAVTKEIFLSGLRPDAHQLRIQQIRSVLETHYLPKAIRAEGGETGGVKAQ